MSKTELQSMGTQIKQRRKALGLTQTELAMLCNLSINGISNIEQGQSDVRWTTLRKIGEILGFQIQLQWSEI
jgi:transcriptional regulator with XRE-family HTH domain